MLTVVEVALNSLEERLNSRRDGKISASMCRTDIEHGVMRLREKLNVTPEIRAALDHFENAGIRFVNETGHPVEPAQRDNVFDDATKALGRLRLALEDAQMPYAARNETLKFAEHTRRNLDHVLEFAATADLHPVTQVILSLLGLVIFPVEKTLEEAVRKTPLDKLTGWPAWNISLGQAKCRTLGDLAKRLRNAVAHRHVMFSSDSRELTEVVIEFEDYRPKATVPHWRADIRADDLRMFCMKFTDYIESTIG